MCRGRQGFLGSWICRLQALIKVKKYLKYYTNLPESTQARKPPLYLFKKKSEKINRKPFHKATYLLFLLGVRERVSKQRRISKRGIVQSVELLL